MREGYGLAGWRAGPCPRSFSSASRCDVVTHSTRSLSHICSLLKMISALCVASLLSFVAGVQHASLLSRPTTPSHVCTRACTFKHTSTLALEPRFFIDQVIARLHTRDLGLVTEPRKVATAYLTKQAMESCIEGDVVETGAFRCASRD